MNKAILFVLAFVLASAFVFAAGDKAGNDTGKIDAKINATLNYGSCVSDAAKVKNECYNATKELLKSCSAVANDTAAKKKCLSDYKSASRACQDAFKATKKGECAKIKASFLEKVRYALA